MNHLELRLLKCFCDEYGIDYYEVDNTLTYHENKKHLLSIARMLSQTLDTFEIERMTELQKQYMKEHFLSYYVACQLADETKSAEVGPPLKKPSFSLKAYIESR